MRTPGGEDGMTLIELIISILILALVIGPLTLVLEFAFASTKAASQRTTDSAGAQLMSSYFVADVQGSDFVWTNDHQTPFAGDFATRCGSANTRLELQYKDASSSAVHAVTYDVIPSPVGATADSGFARRTWTVSGGCNRDDSTTLVNAVDPAGLPTITCSPTNCVSPTNLKMTVNALSENVHNSNLYEKFTFNLTAARRVG